MGKNYSIIDLMIKESEAYANIDQIEQYIQSGVEISAYPVQPLFVAIKHMPLEKVANLLPKFSPEQRQLFLDLDLWRRDKLDINNFIPWVKAYAHTPDADTQAEFVKSSEFLLFLKGKFSISTFDEEEPEYPDNDNYFLSDDRLLIFEYDSKFNFVEEIKLLVSRLYEDMGVEDAYAFLFKLTVDSFLEMQEEEFSFKRERLKDIGFVDYIDALEIENPFPNIAILDNFIKKQKATTGQVDEFVQNQIPSQMSLVAYKEQMLDFNYELSKIESEKRNRFLQYTFVKLINSTIAANDATKKGPVELVKVGKKTLFQLRLGLSYCKSKLPDDCAVLEQLSFVDIYKVGLSLIRFAQKDIKAALRQYGFDQNNEKFLGEFFTVFLDRSFKIPIYIDDESNLENEVTTVEQYRTWLEQIEFFKKTLPFMESFYKTLQTLIEAGKIHSDFYVNYSVEDVNFEAIIMSTFCNYLVDDKNPPVNRLGISLENFKMVVGKIVKNDKTLQSGVKTYCNEFCDEFGLSTTGDFADYLYSLLQKHLLGYKFEALKNSDYKHVGGPIIFG